MFSEYVPNLDLFIQMHVAKAATKSSQIEDTRTEIEEAILPEDEIDIERRDGWTEVNNYILAMRRGMDALDRLPFSSRLLKEAHQTLMQSVRGKEKMPGGGAFCMANSFTSRSKSGQLSCLLHQK